MLALVFGILILGFLFYLWSNRRQLPEKNKGGNKEYFCTSSYRYIYPRQIEKIKLSMQLEKNGSKYQPCHLSPVMTSHERMWEMHPSSVDEMGGGDDRSQTQAVVQEDRGTEYKGESGYVPQLTRDQINQPEDRSKFFPVGDNFAAQIDTFVNDGYYPNNPPLDQQLRNTNLQIRSEAPNLVSQPSLWNQSTIIPDLDRRPFEFAMK